MIDWTEVLLKRLAKLQADPNNSYKDIAKQLSREFGIKLSKNACIGKARRLGLAQRAPGTPRTPTQRRRHDAAKKDRTVNTPELKAAPINPGWTIELPVLPAASGRITIFQLEQGVCHFPFGERPPYAYCGNTTRRGVPYCPHHEKVVYPRGMVR